MDVGLPCRKIVLDISWEALSLWDHQVDAIKMIKDYVELPRAGAALVRMPMGTGKTGIMAVLAQHSLQCSVLIVVPFAQLREQLCSEIANDFWKKIGSAVPNAKEVVAFTPSTIGSIGNLVAEPSILVCTYATLEAVKRKDPNGYRALQEGCSLVLADEGHREPAPSWSKAVRELRLHTVLFTATPYRNDVSDFAIERDFVFRLAEVTIGHEGRAVGGGGAGANLAQRPLFVLSPHGDVADHLHGLALLSSPRYYMLRGEALRRWRDQVMASCAARALRRSATCAISKRGCREGG